MKFHRKISIFFCFLFSCKLYSQVVFTLPDYTSHNSSLGCPEGPEYKSYEEISNHGNRMIYRVSRQDGSSTIIKVLKIPTELYHDFYYPNFHSALADAITEISFSHLFSGEEGLPSVGCTYSQVEGNHIVFYFEQSEYNPLSSECLASFSPSLLIEFAAQLGKILHFIHKKGILYRDLNTGNVLVDNEQKPVLIDFGLSTYEEEKPTGRDGMLSFIAPEVFHRKQQDQKADIWAFGIFLLKLFHDFNNNYLPNYLKVLEGEHSPETLLQELSEGVLPPDKETELLSLLRRILKEDPSQRASLGEILQSDFFTSPQQ